MIKRLVYLLLELIAGIAGNLIAGWVQQDRWSNLFTAERLVATFACAIFVMFLLVWLESNQPSAATIHWHKFWYLIDLIQDLNYRKTNYTSISFKHILNNRMVLDDEIKRSQKSDIVMVLRTLLIERNSNNARFLVLGEAGAGKTTALKQLSLKMASHAIHRGGINRQIPIFIELGNYSGERLFDFISGQLIMQGGQGTELAKMLPLLLAQGHVLLLLDALDEAGGEQSKKITQELAEFLNSPVFQHTPVVITSRTQYGQNYIFRELVTFEVQELGDFELDSFIEVYNQTDTSTENIKNWLNSHNMLEEKGIGRNPFWLKLILVGWKTKRGEYLNINEGDNGQFLNRSIDNLLKLEWDTKLKAERAWRRVLPRVEQLEETKNALAHLAFTMMSSNGTINISKEVALVELSKWITSHVGLEMLRPQDILGLGHDAQLIACEGGTVRFRHRLLQESLAAWKLKIDRQLLLQKAKFLHYIEDATWWETLMLLSEILINEDWESYAQFVELILNAETNERKLILAIGMTQCAHDINNNLHEGVMKILIQGLLTQGATPVFKQAVIDLAAVLNGKKIDFLQTLLSHGHAEIQIVTIYILSAVKSDYSIDLLIPKLEFPSLSEYALGALVAIGPVAVESLIRALRRDGSRDVRSLIIKALGAIGDSRAIQPLLQSFQDDDPTVRATASAALQQIGENAIQPLCILLNHPDFSICAIAAETLTGLGDKVIEQIVPNLKVSENIRFQNIRLQVISAWILWQLGAAAAKPLSEILERFDVDSYGRTKEENLAMRTLGAMIPVYRCSPKSFHQIRQKLSPKASDLVGRVLLKRNWADINARMFAEYAIRHPNDERVQTAIILRSYMKENEKDEESYFIDEAINEYVSRRALNIAYEITHLSNKLRSERQC